MQSTARPLFASEVHHETAVVTAVDDGQLTVRGSSGLTGAKRAASCLLAPALGDVVTVAVCARGVYVTAVLERDAEAPRTLALDGDVDLAVEGRLSMRAKAGIELGSDARVTVASRQLRVHADEVEASMRRGTVVGKLLHRQIEHVREVAGSIEQVAKRFTQRLERSYRFVKEMDQLRAETVDYKADATLHMHSDNTVVTARKLIKVDGDQIHLG